MEKTKEMSIVRIENGFILGTRNHQGEVKERFLPDAKKLALQVKKEAEAEDLETEKEELDEIDEEDL